MSEPTLPESLTEMSEMSSNGMFQTLIPCGAIDLKCFATFLAVLSSGEQLPENGRCPRHVRPGLPGDPCGLVYQRPQGHELLHVELLGILSRPPLVHRLRVDVFKDVLLLVYLDSLGALT